MNQEIDKKKLTPRIHGIIQIMTSIVFFYFHAELFYGYHFTSILYLFMVPDWILVLNMLLGIIGIFIGVNTYKSKLKIWKGYLWLIVIFILGSSVNIIFT